MRAGFGRRRGRRSLAAVLSVLLLLFAACGDDDDTSSDDNGNEEPSGDDSALGTPNEASGEPVKVMYMTVRGSDATEQYGLDTEHGATAAQEYINEYLGGIGGRPLELVFCEGGVTPEQGTECANQAVEQDVVAYVLATAGSGSQMVPIVTGAGIPYITGGGSAAEELTSLGKTFSLSSGYVGSLGAFAQHAADSGFKKVGHVVIDGPSAVQAAEGIGGLTFGNAGVGYEVVTAPFGTADMTPQVQQAATDADAVMVTGDGNFCTSFLRAFETLQPDAKKYVISACVSEEVISAVGTAFEGAFFSGAHTNEGEDAEIFAAILEKYQPDEDIDPNPLVSHAVAAGAAVLIDFARSMEGLTGDVTAATVLAKMKAVNGVPRFMGGGDELICDGTAIPLTPSTCASGSFVGELDGEAQPKSGTLEFIDPTDLYKTG